MNILKSFHQTGAILVSDEGVIISPKEQNNSISVPGSVQASDFPPVEFPSTEGVFQSQIDSPSIWDMLHLRETGISLQKGSQQPENQHQLEEMRETANLNVSAKPTQSAGGSKDPLISENSISGKTSRN